MITRTLPLAAVALLSLAACNNNNQPEVVDTRAPDPMAEQLKNAPAVELPPAIKAQVTFRCQPGNSLIYVDFFEGDKMANLRTAQGGTPTMLRAETAGQPFTGGGYTIDGGPQSATYTAPGGSKLTCKA